MRAGTRGSQPFLSAAGTSSQALRRRTMTDPVVGALAAAIVTLAGIFYRHLLKQIEKGEAEVKFWRLRYFGALGRAEVAADEATKRADDD